MLGSTRKKHRRVTYVLREDEGRHRSGINSLALNRQGSLLFSAGRDATARCWSTGNPRVKCERSFDSHTDWVNDCVLLGLDCTDEATLVTCSSDTTIKLWNVTHEKCLATLAEHSDYVKALAYAPHRKLLASAGLDREVIIWDVEATKGVWSSGRHDDRVHLLKATGHKDSVYCLAANGDGTVIVSGSPERVSTHAIGLLRIWDPRTGQKVGRLKGHTDNVRCVGVSADGSRCVSGSSDGTVKVWDIGQQRCLHTFTMHSDSVWSLAADPTFDTIFSAGRDQHVFSTDLRTLDSCCLFRTRDPVLKLVLTPDCGVWVSMTNADIELWQVDGVLQRERAARSASRKPSVHSINHTGGRKSLSSLSPGQDNDSQPIPMLSAAAARIEGLPGVVKHDLLDNRREVLVQDSCDDVYTIDVTSGRRTKSFGRVNFEETRRGLEQQVAVPAWCSVDCKLGSLSVKLDFPQVFACELYASDAGFPQGGDYEEAKINVGLRVCRSLFREWRAKRKDGEGGVGRRGDGQDDHIELDEKLDYVLPRCTRVNVSEGGASGGAALASKVVHEWDGTETALLPEWVVQSIERGYGANERGEPTSDAPKIGFHLLRHPASDMPQMQQGKLNAPQILRARKVLSYAVSKLGLQDPPPHMLRDGYPNAVDYLELLCQDQIVPPEMNLMSIRKFLAKSTDDLTLHYRWKESWRTGGDGGARGGMHDSVARGYA